MTEIILRPRGGGKTTEMIRRSAEDGGYIVCTDHRRACQVAKQAEQLGLSIPFPLTAGEWHDRGYRAPGVRALLFDDLDRIIQAMSGVPVVAATWTQDEEQHSERVGT